MAPALKHLRTAEVLVHLKLGIIGVKVRIMPPDAESSFDSRRKSIGGSGATEGGWKLIGSLDRTAEFTNIEIGQEIVVYDGYTNRKT